MSHQLMLEIPDDVYQPLLQRAQASGQAVEEVARACLAEAVQKEQPGSRLRRWAGAFDSGVPDASLRHDEFLGEALYEELGEKEPDATVR